MAAFCLACRLDTWPLERHRIALITDPTERVTPKSWIWLCQTCVRRWRAGEPLGLLGQQTAAPGQGLTFTNGTAALTGRQREVAALMAQGEPDGTAIEQPVERPAALQVDRDQAISVGAPMDGSPG